MIIDPLSDFFTRIRNAQAARHETVLIPTSKLKLAVARILVREGYIEQVAERQEDNCSVLEIRLRYRGQAPWIRLIRRVSTPGCRVYRKSDKLPRVLSDQGVAIISTSAGIMTNKEARKRKLGGEILGEVC